MGSRDLVRREFVRELLQLRAALFGDLDELFVRHLVLEQLLIAVIDAALERPSLIAGAQMRERIVVAAYAVTVIEIGIKPTKGI